MYELDLFREIKTKKVSVLFGNQYIEDNLLREYPNTEERNHLTKQPFKVYDYIITSEAVNKEEQDNLIIDWFENKDTFTQSDLLDIVDKQVQQLISLIKISISITNNEHIANRLNSLFKAAKEEDTNSPGISLDSIHSFYNFLKKHTDFKYPVITLTPDNDIYASWKGGLNQVFSVHFVSNENTYFVIFKPNENNPERRIISYGTEPVETLLEAVKFTGIYDWISDER